MVKLERILWPGLFLLLVSVGALADEQSSEKPEDWERRLEMLRSVPYVTFSDSGVDESEGNVEFYDREKAYPGYNLYCSGLSREAYLLDMNGRVMHRWTETSTGDSSTLHHAVMLENGDLIMIRKPMELLRLGWNSELIWKKKLRAHHEVTQAPDGSFFTIIALDEINYRGHRVVFDAMVHLTADGEEIGRWSTYEHLGELKDFLDTRSFLDTVFDSISSSWSPGDEHAAEVKKKEVQGQPDKKYDYFHMNTITILPGTVLGERDSRFQRGNLLVCFRNVNQIAVLEKDTYRVLWAWGEGELEWPHHPTMLPNGHILVFDNGDWRGYSRVVELDPVAEDIVWEYKAEPPEDFYTSIGGSAQRFPNGNTLICETHKARVFEVTQEGEVVWVWRNPTIKRFRRETVYRMIRLPLVQVDSLLDRWRGR